MVDFNPAQFAVNLFKEMESPSASQGDKANLKFTTFTHTKQSGKQTNIFEFNLNGKFYHLVDSDNDGNIDSVSIMTKTDKGVSVDYYLDKGDDGSFDVHKHSGRDGHYVEYRPKWYNPATWIKHEE